jgi:hypothetical protein
MSKTNKIDFGKFHPKHRTGRECKKVNCSRHESYLKWNCGDNNLDFCMKCKNAHVSQYKAKEPLTNNTGEV